MSAPATVAAGPDLPPPPVLGPPRPPWWPGPAQEVPWSLLGAMAVAGVLAGTTLVGARAGLPMTLLLLLAVTVVALHRRVRPPAPLDLPMLLTAALLATVPLVRAEALLVALAALAVLVLLSVVALGRTRWAGLLLSPPLGAVAAVRGCAWLLDRPPAVLRRTRLSGGLLRGLLAAAVLVAVLLVLLASADAAFARLVELRVPEALVPRLLLAGCAALVVLGLGLATVAPPGPELRPGPPAASPAEWLLPLLAADAVLLAFLGVQGVVLLDPEAALAGTGVTPSAWAREGFGQLVAVTVLLLGTLGWAVHRVDGGVRAQVRLLRGGGGLLTLLVLAVVASALSRMALYTDRFGATTLRLYVVVFECWLAAVVLLVVLTWLRRRPALLPRSVLATGAATLLLLAAAGPEALVARYSVERFERTGAVDLAYLASLSADAAPALAALPEPQRSAALDDPGPDAWYAVNLARLRAGARLVGPAG